MREEPDRPRLGGHTGWVLQMQERYFSERERGPRPRVQEEITKTAWSGIVALIWARNADGSLGYLYPAQCPDGHGTYGCDEAMLRAAVIGEHPDIPWPLTTKEAPPTLAVLDFIEFCYRAVAKPVKTSYHSFFRHWHLDFDVEEGRAGFRRDVNRIFERNGLAYELDASGQVRRLGSPVLAEALGSVLFRTGDIELDGLLETARRKYLDPDPAIRKEALEKLWDAFERIKTLEPGRDKRQSAEALLTRVAGGSPFRRVLDEEAGALTRIGNSFGIRHSETTQEHLNRPEEVDYLFHRLFALIWLMLRTTGRVG